MSQSLTIAPNVHPSGTSSMSSPLAGVVVLDLEGCQTWQTVIQLQNRSKALPGSDHKCNKSQKMSEDRLTKARMAITQLFCF